MRDYPGGSGYARRSSRLGRLEAANQQRFPTVPLVAILRVSGTIGAVSWLTLTSFCARGDASQRIMGPVHRCHHGAACSAWPSSALWAMADISHRGFLI